MDTPVTEDQPKKATPEPFNDPKADFILLSSDGVAFHVHSVLLSLVSPVFGTMFEIPQGSAQELYEGKPFVSLADQASSLYLLLTWCDPRCTSRSSRLEDLQVVLEVADKYGMESVMKLVTAAMLSMKAGIASEPLRVFAIAARFRLEELAKVAALEAIKTPFQDWEMCEEMNHISAPQYHYLLLYQRRCIAAAKRCADWFYWVLTQAKWQAFCEECVEEDGAQDGDCDMEERMGIFWVVWFLKYMALASEALGKCPAGDTVQAPDLLHQTHNIISQVTCPCCRETGPSLLHRFMKDFSATIDDRLSSVEFKL